MLDIINMRGSQKRNLIYGSFIFLIVSITSSCKEEVVVNSPKNPKITYVTPLVGTLNTEVTIQGENFGKSIGANQVTINGKEVEIVEAQESEIKVKIPKDLGTGEVTVTTAVAKARGPEFVYFNEAVITSANPLSGPFNTVVVIKGENFENESSLNQVQINGKTLPVLSSSVSEITVSIPVGTGSGKIEVKTQYARAEGPIFEYVLVPVVSTMAGNGFPGFADGAGDDAQFNNPDGLAVDTEDNVYICDRGNNRIRKMDLDGNVATWAGSGVQGINDGSLQNASFFLPSGIVRGDVGEFFVTDSGSGTIRKITTNDQVITLAGDGVPGFTDGIGSTARFGSPRGIVVDGDGNLWVADYGNSVIRRVSPAGEVTTIAGDGTPGFANGIGLTAEFNFPIGLQFDNSGMLLVADYLNNRIRSMSLAGEVGTYAGDNADYVDGPLQESRYNGPTAMALDLSGDLILADALNYRIRRIKEGVVTTIAGDGDEGLKDGIGIDAKFGLINSIVVNSKGEIIISDGSNHVIRKIVYQ